MFLHFLNCESFEDYLKGVVDTSFVTPIEHTHEILLKDGVSNNTGTILFRNTKSSQTARLCYSCQEILLDRSTLDMVVVCRFYNIRWSDITWTIMGLLTCKIRLTLVPWRSIVVENAPYIAVRIQDLPVSSLTTELKSRCITGRNIVYKMKHGGTKTYRSILVPHAMLHVDPLPHDDMWLIAVSGCVQSVSDACESVLEIPHSVVGKSLQETIPKYHTGPDFCLVQGMLKQLECSADNESVAVEVDFCLSKSRIKVNICGYKINHEIRVFVFKLH